MLTLTKLNLLDIVALKINLPDRHLLAGQVGTIVEILAPEVYEVEFSDDDGQTYATQSLPANQLLKLHYKSMSNNTHQYGSGDNVTGDKVIGDKIMRDKINTQFNNDLQGANIGNLANEVKDNAQQTATNFNQTSGANIADILQLIQNLRQTALQFPDDVREDLIIDVEAIEQEIQKPQPHQPTLKKRLLALLATAATVTFTDITGMIDFANNVMEISSKIGIALPKVN